MYPKLYIPSTLNIELILWHTQLIVCAGNVKSWFKSWVFPFTLQAFGAIHGFVCVLAYLNFNFWAVLMLPKKAGSAQTHKGMSFIWSTLYLCISLDVSQIKSQTMRHPLFLKNMWIHNWKWAFMGLYCIYASAVADSGFFLNFLYQGGVKSTVFWVFEDLKFKILEGYDQNWWFPDSAQLAVSV